MIGWWVGQDFRLVTDTWLVAVGGLVGLVATGFGVYAVVRAPKLLLTACVLAAVSALLLVGGWLLAVPGTSRVDVLKTSGLAGAAVLALYGLWINDRRRRTEEARHQLDRERISDERFAKAVELLGKEADQVRVGALHVLAGLARARPDYTQTVLDVLCAYLRRPFLHPSYQSNPADPGRAEVAPSDERWTEEHGIADRERQVRATAQRLITELLPSSSAPEPESYNLDLTGAALEFFNLSGCHIGQLTARRAHFYGSTRLDNLRASRIMLLSGARFSGRSTYPTRGWKTACRCSRPRSTASSGSKTRSYGGCSTSAPAHRPSRSARSPPPRTPTSNRNPPTAGPWRPSRPPPLR